MGKKIDLTGQTFGEWTVLSDSGKRMGGFILWDCRCSCGRVVPVIGSNLRRGLTSSCGMCKNVYGLGENDIGAENSCPYYQTWKRVLERTISPTRDKVYPSYMGVTLFEGWLKLSSFKAWMETKNWLNLEIDKDLLVQGSKQYSPTTCTFVPEKINLLLGTSDGKRGIYPLGVSLHNNGVNKYISRCSGKYLGLYATPEEAHKAWQVQKSKDIVEAVEWWQFDCNVNHSFNQTISENLFKLSAKIGKDVANGVETELLRV